MDISQGITAKELEIYQNTINKSIDDTKLNIKKWDEYKEDYVKLKSVLQNITDEVQHTAMIPFSNLAFFPGKLIHTNEVLVLLGDNWFVERSSKQACEIIDRRIKFVDENLTKLKKDKNELEQKINFSKSNLPIKHDELNEEGMNYFEIREDYNENEEKIINEISDKTSKIHINLNETEKKKEMSAEDEAILRMLKQAELEEEMENKQKESNEYDEFIKSLKEYEKGSDDDKSENDDDDDDDDDENDDMEFKKEFEKFKAKYEKNNPKQPLTNNKEGTDLSKINNPADIYKHILNTTLKAKENESKNVNNIHNTSIVDKGKGKEIENENEESIKQRDQQKSQIQPKKKKSSLFKNHMNMKRQEMNIQKQSSLLQNKTEDIAEPIVKCNAGVKSVVFEHVSEKAPEINKPTNKKGKVSLFKSQRMMDGDNRMKKNNTQKIEPSVKNIVKENTKLDTSINEDQLDMYFFQREANQEYQKKKYLQSLISKEKPLNEINEKTE